MKISTICRKLASSYWKLVAICRKIAAVFGKLQQFLVTCSSFQKLASIYKKLAPIFGNLWLFSVTCDRQSYNNAKFLQICGNLSRSLLQFLHASDKLLQISWKLWQIVRNLRQFFLTCGFSSETYDKFLETCDKLLETCDSLSKTCDNFFKLTVIFFNLQQ